MQWDDSAVLTGGCSFSELNLHGVVEDHLVCLQEVDTLRKHLHDDLASEVA